MVIRARRPEDDAALVALLNDLHAPLPAATVEEFRAEIALVPPGYHAEILVAEQEGRIVGYGRALEMFWTGGPGTFAAGIGVAPPWREQGIGSALSARLLASLTGWGAERLHTDVREDRPAGMAFARRHGFVESGHIARLSWLEVDAATLDGYADLADRLGREGVRVRQLAALGAEDEGTLRAIHTMQMAAAADEPTAEPFSVPFGQWREMMRGTPGLSPETIWVALAGERPIGLTMLRRQGARDGYQFGMGVDRAYRGRGVARLLKLRQIEWAREHGVEALYTSNDINNPRMYDINVRLGYQPLPALVHLTRDL